MSTKTTIKRIALVAVSALGLGMVTGVGANATATAVTIGTSTGFSLNASSITLVATDTTTLSNNYAVYEVTLANSDGYSAPLQLGESLTATVVSAPAAAGGSTPNKNNIDVVWGNAADWTPSTNAVTTAASGQSATINEGNTGNSNNTGKVVDTNVVSKLRGGSGDTSATVPYVAGTYNSLDSTFGIGNATYFLKVALNSNAGLDLGAYGIRIDLLDRNSNAIKSQTVKLWAVSSKVVSGAVLTPTVAGTKFAGGALYNSKYDYVKVALTNPEGGLVRETGNLNPVLSATLKDAATTPVSAMTGALSIDDNGSTGTDALSGVASDGVYNIGGTLVASPTAGTGTLSVSYGATTATASVTIGTVASGTGTAKVTATGIYDVTAASHQLPLTTKSFTTYVVDGTATTGKAYYYSVAYTGCVTADMSATANTTTKVLTDATGVASLTITNANPIDGCQAVVTWTGATMTNGQQTVKWSAPVATTVVSDPSDAIQAVTGSTNKVTWTILDQFKAPVAGKTVTFTMTGANAPTAGLASQISDAKGQVSYSWTDAKSVVGDATLGADAVSIAKVGIDSPTNTAVTVTYKAALSVIAGINAYYGTPAAGATIVAPTTAIGGAAGKAISANDQLDMTLPITAAADPGAVAVKFSPVTSALAAVSGLPVTVTITGSGKLLDAAGYMTTSRTVYKSTTFTVVGTGTGIATVTATAGTVSKVVTINFANADTDARVLSATESAGTITATVKDFNGNAVGGVTVGVALSSGRLANGASSGTFVTAPDGTVSFDVTGAATATLSLSSTYPKASFLAGYGDATGTVVTTGAPAGVRKVTVETAGVSSTNDAIDAANEATDAANAATDAANAAAEAADAATAAAQDAQAAVADLAAQVATLIAGIKAQITSLTNLVIKIQKKVKA